MSDVVVNEVMFDTEVFVCSIDSPVKFVLKGTKVGSSSARLTRERSFNFVSRLMTLQFTNKIHVYAIKIYTNNFFKAIVGFYHSTNSKRCLIIFLIMHKFMHQNN